MLDQFVRQNRWWADPSAIEGDRHLVRVREARLPWTPRLPFRFEQDAIYTLRGPRQVGESTILKQHIKALIDEGWPPRQILYLDVELAGLERGADLVAALRTYLEGARAQPVSARARCAVFLDEVIRVENWAGALRGLVNAGGGLVVTRDSEGYLASGSAYSLPAADLLAAIHAPSLCPCRL